MSFGGFYSGGGVGSGGESRMVMADGSFNNMPMHRPQLITSTIPHPHSIYNSQSLSLALVCIHSFSFFIFPLT